MNKPIIYGLTHPTIHTDYYKWLSCVNKGGMDTKFIEQHSKSFEDFHAIAMWVWSSSREILAVQENVKDTLVAAERYEKVRKLNPRQYHDLWSKSLEGHNFDELVDELK